MVNIGYYDPYALGYASIIREVSDILGGNLIHVTSVENDAIDILLHSYKGGEALDIPLEYHQTFNIILLKQLKPFPSTIIPFIISPSLVYVEYIWVPVDIMALGIKIISTSVRRGYQLNYRFDITSEDGKTLERYHNRLVNAHQNTE